MGFLPKCLPSWRTELLRGITNINLDTKGRLAVPTRYRENLEESCKGNLIVTVESNHCLLIYPIHEWEEIERQLVKLPTFNENTRKLQRLLMGHATDVVMDGSGRVLIPQPLRDFANLDKRVVLLGQGNKFELWDEQHWTESRDEWVSGNNDSLSLPAGVESLSI